MINKKELIEKPKNKRPHVVLLGAGASRAAFPNGDASGNKLPIMDDLVDILNLRSLLEDSSLDLTDNFENIYSSIKDKKLKKKLETHIDDYFSKLSLPDTATHYDRLLLSLREKDAIFTFNWDPFLFDAYERNRNVASLPGIYFLHGNVRIGYCKKDNKWGRRNYNCPDCNEHYKKVPLLYPIERKDYFNSNNYIRLCWETAENLFSEALMITIFGYSAPTSDVEAIDLLENAWFQRSNREFEHIEVIDIIDKSIIETRWEKFTPTNHLMIEHKFEESYLWKFPRRTCEALIQPMVYGIPCESFDLDSTDNLLELQKIIIGISLHEKKVRNTKMIQYKNILNRDKNDGDKLLNKLLAISNNICKEKNITISNIENEEVTFNNDYWIEINFKIKNCSPDEITKLNIILAKELSKNDEFLKSEIEYIPSFICEE